MNPNLGKTDSSSNFMTIQNYPVIFDKNKDLQIDGEIGVQCERSPKGSDDNGWN